MNIVTNFKINETDSIEVLIPNFRNKENYYYKPVKELHMFDIVTVKYRTKASSIILTEDAVSEVFGVIRNHLLFLLHNDRRLPNNVNASNLGFQYNIDTEVDSDDVNYSNYWLFSSRGIQTWLYNKDGKMYLEIAPSYPWHYIEPVEDEEVISFEEFMQKYKPLAIYELNEATVKEWIQQADFVLEKMIKVKK